MYMRIQIPNEDVVVVRWRGLGCDQDQDTAAVAVEL